MELLVVIGIIAVLVGLSMPALNALQKSYDSTGSESMIISALSTARTLAISKGKYAGVRFQKEYVADSNKVLSADQYMIFIVNDNDIRKNMDYIFRAIEGYKPIKLPANTGVTDCKIFNDEIVLDSQIDENIELTETTTFSIVFSPAGKIVTHDVEIRNKDGLPSGTTSEDTVFNTEEKITDSTSPAGQFLQDPNPRAKGLGREKSRNKFKIYDTEKFKKLDKGKRYTDYLKHLNYVHINPYTGEIIK